MKKKIVSLMVLCLLVGMVSAVNATLITDAQDWIDTNSYGITSVDVGANTVNSEFWELTNASSVSSMTFYHEIDPSYHEIDPSYHEIDPSYGFGIYPTVGDTVTVFQPVDEPVDTATIRFYVDDDKVKVVVTEWELSTGITKTTISNFTGDTFGYWMGYYQDDGWAHLVRSDDENNWLTVQMDAGSYMLFGDVDGNGTMDMAVQAESVSPAPVPEPATMLLFGTGLAGMAGFMRKRKISTKV